jgi:hypothetical protein
MPLHHLINAEFVREQNQRILSKLYTVQDAGLMRSSSQVPIQEAELLYNEDVSNGPISLGDNDDHGSISRRSFPRISTKSLPWTRVGIYLMGLHYVVHIRLTHRHMRRAITMLQFRMSRTWTWLDLQCPISGVTSTNPHIPFLAKGGYWGYGNKGS